MEKGKHKKIGKLEARQLEMAKIWRLCSVRVNIFMERKGWRGEVCATEKKKKKSNRKKAVRKKMNGGHRRRNRKR